jgi:hypothetical protein
MTVGKLKELLDGMPDDMKVLIPANPMGEFDGILFSPCEEDSGVSEVGGDGSLDEEELERQDNLGILPVEKVFLLLPCGYGEEKNHTHTLN